MHVPVLLNEIIEYLDPRPGQVFIDCTVGGGGHFKEIYKRIQSNGKILGIDFNKNAIDNLRKNNFENAVLAQGNFKNLKQIAKENGFDKVDGILMDLGFSNIELEEGALGLSFQKDEPLDMRTDSEAEISAEEIVNNWREEELVDIFSKFGEERFSKRIARAIVEARKKQKIETTFDLVDVIKNAIPSKFRYGKIHFATKVFQALRIAVNDELENLKKALGQAIEILNSEGRIAVISFHSGEDRIVKNFLRDNKDKINILTKKPIIPSADEINKNPKSRSAKLRMGQSLG